MEGLPSKQAGRALEPARRASEPAGRALDPVGRALDPVERASKQARRASEEAAALGLPLFFFTLLSSKSAEIVRLPAATPT